MQIPCCLEQLTPVGKVVLVPAVLLYMAELQDTGKEQTTSLGHSTQQHGEEGSDAGWFELEQCLGYGTPWLESPEGCGNHQSVIPSLWKNPGCETLWNARMLLLLGVLMP